MWHILATARNRTIEKNLGQHGDAQRRLLQKILQQLEGCQIAHDLRIDHTSTIERFRSAVPVTNYSFYKPYIGKILDGRRSIMFPGHPVCIAQTGGTTSCPKQIPLGKHLIRSYRQFNLDMAFCYMQDSGHYDIFSDRIFLVVASPDAAGSGKSIPIGRATGVMAQIAPWPLRRRYVPEMDVILNTNTRQRIEQTTVRAFRHRQHVRMAAGLTPYLMAAFSNLIHHARDNSLNCQTASDIFPHLRVAFHGGTTFDLYSQKMQSLAGETVDHRNIYSAAEGPIAFQLAGASPGLTPALDAVFFEFLPVAQAIRNNPDTVLLDEVECGVPYYILLTTQGGLLRYKIGDQVEFIENEPPLMRVLGRVEDQIDLSSEKLGVDDAAKALMQTADSLGLHITDFLVCPAVAGLADEQIAHEWIIECENRPNDLSRFRETLDAELFECNSWYRQLRDHEFALGPPKVRFVAYGTFQRYMENELIYGQQKMFHMHNDRSCAERLLCYD
jgi:hypothetical protein